MSEVMVSDRDDKRIITDVAFGVEPKLLGRKLATPFQRGAAMLIDASLVLLLTEVSGVFWGMFVGAAFFRAGRRRRVKSWRITRLCLRLLGALVLFISVLSVLSDPPTFDSLVDGSEKTAPLEISDEGTVAGQELSLSNLMSYGNLTAKIIEFNTRMEQEDDCNIDCRKPEILTLVDTLLQTGLPRSEAINLVTDSIPQHYFSDDEHKAEFVNSVHSHFPDQEPNAAVTSQTVQNREAGSAKNNGKTKAAEETPVYSAVEYVKALISDLGLGFGWAALYFTAFSAWWRGQTPGKKLFGIRVIQLDGTYMSAWDSFGRYGGYGAGFATGLMGFMQVLWDANRQAIQDKISATVVIQGDIEQNVREN